MLACVLLFCYEIDIVSEASQPAAMSTPSNSSSLSSDLLEQLKAQLPESLFATVSGTFASYEKQLDTKSNELQYARLKIQLLEEKLRLQRIAKYGPGSEKLSNEAHSARFNPQWRELAATSICIQAPWVDGVSGGEALYFSSFT